MSSIVLRFTAEPRTVNANGKVQGGTVMSWIDEAAQTCANRWANRDCVTVATGAMRFLRPILIGDLVEVEARLVFTGTTSMNIAVQVRSGNVIRGEMHIVTDCLTVFVAVDEEGRPLPVAAWSPETPGDMALAERVRAHLQASRMVA